MRKKWTLTRRIRRRLNRIFVAVWRRRLCSWLPRLVWLDDEIDVVVTLANDTARPDQHSPALFNRGSFEIEKALRNLGITFDICMGQGGCDWQWDYSLSGPISVRFKGRAKRPERRLRRDPTI